MSSDAGAAPVAGTSVGKVAKKNFVFVAALLVNANAVSTTAVKPKSHLRKVFMEPPDIPESVAGRRSVQVRRKAAVCTNSNEVYTQRQREYSTKCIARAGSRQVTQMGEGGIRSTVDCNGTICRSSKQRPFRRCPQ